jgi:nitric oxide reductase subunit B
MKTTKKLWGALAVISLLSFAVLLWIGHEIWLAAPPIPKQVVSEQGQVLFADGEVERGQGVWLAAGGQQLGSVWGHGSYIAPDWSADWLHREALVLRQIWAQRDYGQAFDTLAKGPQAELNARLQTEMRRNGYDAATGRITLSADRTQAVQQVMAHYTGLFGNDAALDKLREQYAMANHSLSDPADLHALSSFFFWAAWSAGSDRPGQGQLSYTSNWPHEPLVGNTPTAEAGIWSIASVILMIAAIGGMVFWHSAHSDETDPTPPKNDPLFELKPTPSMRATFKYFFVVIGLILVQVGMGVISAHYAVEGQSFFGLPLAQILPFSISRTIHTQFAVLWIATAWLATGLYIAPAISGQEPKFQKLGVNVLFYALLLIVVGSTACGWLGTLQHRGVDFSFWIGNQGLEYTSMGRVWQILLFIGLLFWVLLLGRGLWPALKKPSESRGLIAMVFLAAMCIGAFYATSLAWGQKTHYAMIEYWRWWLVHLWVEGFFEVFATAVIALLFTRLGLIRATSAHSAIVLETIVFLFGGILGTLHHLYFTGTPTFVIAIGAMFSALEVVPLAMIGVEAYRNYRRSQAAVWVQNYKWAIMCFMAVGFWNLVGAGLLGFTINTPIALYYMQGMNLTAAHGHAALFGVYGMLGIGLMLFCLRGLADRNAWSDKLLAPMFWSMNIGLAMMTFMSLVPSGIYQAWASITQGTWFARSPEVIHSAFMETMVWLRVPGDVVFSVGVMFLLLFAVRLASGGPRGQVVGNQVGNTAANQAA